VTDEQPGPGDKSQFVALVPGGGWMIFHSTGMENYSSPVVAWALQANGEVVPLEADDDGRVYAHAAEGSGDSAELWHPESSSRRAQTRRQNHRDQIGRGGD
jgi:hypothetical protein